MTFLLETLKLGFANLLLHKLRSLLTALGIIIGVAAVIAVVAIGEGSKRKVLADIEKLGARNIIVRSVKPPQSGSRSSQQTSFTLAYGLSREDERKIQAVARRNPAIKRIVPLKLAGKRASNGDKQISAGAFGTEPQLLDVTSLRVERGRYLTHGDDDRVAVIGAKIAQELFPLEDPLDGWVTVHNGGRTVPLKVIGVLHPVGLAGGAGTALVGRDLNFDIHIPMQTAISDFGDMITERQAGSYQRERLELSELYIEAVHQDSVLAVADEIDNILARTHREKSDVTTVVPLELLEQAERTQRMFTVFLAFIAGVSLLVGGIGIMNIMLASVTERTREIGIRRALGATRKHIIAQFLVETTTLSGVGGFVGVIVGISAAAAVSALHGVVPGVERPYIATWSIIAGISVAMVVGVVFGLYPAIKASAQDPIVALRHD